MSKIIVAGSMAFDHIMAITGRFKDYIMPDKVHILNISFDVDKLSKSYGGNAGNICYGLALLEMKPLLVAGVGSDFGEYEHWLKKAGVNMAGVVKHKDILTASGFVVTDKDDNQIWSFYRGAMAKAREIALKQWIGGKDDLVFLAPNDALAIEKYVAEMQTIEARMVFDPSFQIPVIKPKSLEQGIKRAEIVMGNDYEIELLLRRTKMTKKQALGHAKLIITTLGAQGSVIESAEKKIIIPAMKIKTIVDPTGAGDAYRSGFITGYVQGLPLEVCGRMGSVTGGMAVEYLGTQTYTTSLGEFKKRYQNTFGEAYDQTV